MQRPSYSAGAWLSTSGCRAVKHLAAVFPKSIAPQPGSYLSRFKRFGLALLAAGWIRRPGLIQGCFLPRTRNPSHDRRNTSIGARNAAKSAIARVLKVS